MQKIVIAMDSFKGCLSSLEAGRAVELGVHDIFPQAQTLVLGVSDGGEGLLRCLCPKDRQVPVRVHGPMEGSFVDACYGVLPDDTAVIESAQVIGLPLVPPAQRNPLLASSYGLGEMMREVMARGHRRMLIGLGGSATCDGGTGMLEALGFRLIGRDGAVVSFTSAQPPVPHAGLSVPHAEPDPASPIALQEIVSVEAPDGLEDVSIVAACDVVAPLLGPCGAARLYAPQKGASPQMVDELEQGMRSWAHITFRQTGADIAALPRAGAAGGLGAALHAWLGAPLRSGIDAVLDAVGFDQAIAGADLIITGEGRLDAQTLQGKVPAGVLARAAGIPVVALAGSVADNYLDSGLAPGAHSHAGFAAALSINPPDLLLSQAMLPQVAKANLRAAVAKVPWLVVAGGADWCRR